MSEQQQQEPLASVLTKQFWLDAADRAIKSFAQGAIIGIALALKGDRPFTGIPWVDVILFGLFMAILSVLMSVGSIPFGSKGTASAVKGVTYIGNRVEGKHRADDDGAP